jgi:glucose/arabinose dehydrogenase
MAFDVVTNEIYVTDVGQELWEEINVLPLESAGATNFGWPIVEGAECYEAETCDRTGLAEPTVPIIHEYICSLIGGPVYYGNALPELWGNYVYGDFCIGWVRTLKMVDGEPTRMRSWERDLGRLGMITSFGTDDDGEILVLNTEGELRRIIRDPNSS